MKQKSHLHYFSILTIRIHIGVDPYVCSDERMCFSQTQQQFQKKQRCP